MLLKRQTAKAYLSVFQGEDGEFVLYDILRAGHFFEPTFQAPRGRDGMAMLAENAFREGERNMALRILSMLKLSEKELQRLEREHTAQLERMAEIDRNAEQD